MAGQFLVFGVMSGHPKDQILSAQQTRDLREPPILETGVTWGLLGGEILHRGDTRRTRGQTTSPIFPMT